MPYMVKTNKKFVNFILSSKNSLYFAGGVRPLWQLGWLAPEVLTARFLPGWILAVFAPYATYFSALRSAQLPICSALSCRVWPS